MTVGMALDQIPLGCVYFSLVITMLTILRMIYNRIASSICSLKIYMEGGGFDIICIL